jgi:hypothetical protein
MNKYLAHTDTPLLAKGKGNKTSHQITSIKETLTQVCNKRINPM